MIGRLRDGELIAGAAGAVQLVALGALDWYGASSARSRVGFDAWQAFSVTDVVLAISALLGIALAVAQAGRPSPAIPVALSVLCATFGGCAALLALYRVLDAPGPDAIVEVRVGAWVGLALAFAIALGGWRSLRVEEIPGAPAVAVERLPVPPRSA